MVVPMTYAADGQRRRGRPPRISRDDIVDAACELGIENLTMAAVAERLGVTHQSLYGWVQDRDELIDLVSDRLIRRVKIVPPANPADWRDSLRSYANGLRRLAAEMPGFAAAGLGRFRNTDGFMELNHDFVLVLTDIGFEPALAQRVYETLNTVLLGWSARDGALSTAGRRIPSEDSVGLQVEVGASERRLPTVRLALSEADAAADERFEFLIHTFLAGLPDPPPRRDALDAPSVLDLTSSLEVAPGLTGRV
jgi:AcrR family transcriptional regulator